MEGPFLAVSQETRLFGPKVSPFEDTWLVDGLVERALYFPYASSSDFNLPAFSDPFNSWRGGFGWNSPRPAMYHSSCLPAVSLNGSDPRGWAVNDFRPEDVEAIEVYKTNRVPNDFLYANPTCGLVVIWTK